MKKLTRSQRQYLIEKGKTLVIVVLCVCCVRYMFRVIDLYRGESNVGTVVPKSENVQLADKAMTENTVNRYWNMTAPDMVMLEYDKGKYVFESTDEEYGQLIDIIKAVVKDMYTQGTEAFSESTDSDWKTALSGNVLYARFGCAHKTDFESRIFSQDNSAMPNVIEQYSELVLVPDFNKEEIGVLVRTQHTDKVYAVTSKTSTAMLEGILKNLMDKHTQNYVFAHELNLDKIEGHNLSLDSMLLLPLEEETEPTIITSIPETYKTGVKFTQTTEFAINLINAFGYNVNTVRQYADSNGSIILVCETGTISVHPDGQIVYKALGESDGVSLMSTTGKKQDISSLVDGIFNLNQSILSLSGANIGKRNAELRFSQSPEINQLSDGKFVMDYYVDNCRVELGNSHAVEAVLKKGVLVEYKIKVRSIEVTDNEEPCGDVMSAIDVFCKENSDCKKIIGNSLVYKVTEAEKETSAVWKIRGE